MSLHFLNFIESKTEVIAIVGRPWLANTLDPLSFNIRSSVKTLRVYSDNGFKLELRISSVIKSSFFQLRLVAKNKAYLPPRDLERAIHAFITSCLDYYMSLCVGLDQSSVQHLQLVQNAAARLLTGKRKSVHITTLLWFPMFLFYFLFLQSTLARHKADLTWYFVKHRLNYIW